MSLQKLARELDETARQTAAMVDGITSALEILAAESGNSDANRREAVAMIVSALQGQDRIEQRCQNMALAVRQFALLPATAPDSDYDEIWANLVLDELRTHAEEIVARAGMPPIYTDYVGVLLSNEVWREQLAAVPFERRLLLLPKCLRIEDKCPAPFDELGLLCKQCGLCTIQDLQAEAERLRTPQHRDALAAAVVSGIEAFARETRSDRSERTVNRGI